MKFFVFGLLFFITSLLSAQSETDSLAVDENYLEDQFYIGLTYNFLLNKPKDIDQQSLSYGLRVGFIKDIPLNSDRTVALGIGAGYGVYSYYSELLATETEGSIGYSIVNIDGFKRNKLETHMLEVPIEFRWRRSTPIEHKFWRIYAGVNLSYVMGARSKFVTDKFKNTFFNTDVTKFQYGLTFNIGWNTFNLHAYYALNKLFQKEAQFNGASIDMRPLRIGFIFYIL